MPMKNPPHPGDFIRTEIVEPAGLTVTAAAAALKVSRPALSSLLNSKADLSGDMALRIEKAFGVKMDTLMRMQSAYDIAQTRKRETEAREGNPGTPVPPHRRYSSVGFSVGSSRVAHQLIIAFSPAIYKRSIAYAHLLCHSAIRCR